MSTLKITLSILLTQLALTGCVSSLKPSPVSVEVVDFPVVNENRVAEVGERLVGQGNVTKFTGIKALQGGICSDFAGAGPIIRSGEVFQEYGTQSDNIYCSNGIVRNAFGTEFDMQRCLSKKPDGTFTYGMGMNCEMPFEQGRFVALEAENFQRTLYYSGKSGDEIYFEYREFKGDIARPAFTHNLTFDLTEGNLVGFRGLRLRVISATNTQIEYVLEQNFSDRQ
jgi:hypothetical protein